jgi:hypothetical protein
MNNEYYKMKYLKYKQKYINKKNKQIGGAQCHRAGFNQHLGECSNDSFSMIMLYSNNLSEPIQELFNDVFLDSSGEWNPPDEWKDYIIDFENNKHLLPPNIETKKDFDIFIAEGSNYIKQLFDRYHNDKKAKIIDYGIKKIDKIRKELTNKMLSKKQKDTTSIIQKQQDVETIINKYEIELENILNKFEKLYDVKYKEFISQNKSINNELDIISTSIKKYIQETSIPSYYIKVESPLPVIIPPLAAKKSSASERIPTKEIIKPIIRKRRDSISMSLQCVKSSSEIVNINRISKIITRASFEHLFTSLSIINYFIISYYYIYKKTKVIDQSVLMNTNYYIKYDKLINPDNNTIILSNLKNNMYKGCLINIKHDTIEMNAHAIAFITCTNNDTISSFYYDNNGEIDNLKTTTKIFNWNEYLINNIEQDRPLVDIIDIIIPGYLKDFKIKSILLFHTSGSPETYNSNIINYNYRDILLFMNYINNNIIQQIIKIINENQILLEIVKIANNDIKNPILNEYLYKDINTNIEKKMNEFN